MSATFASAPGKKRTILNLGKSTWLALALMGLGGVTAMANSVGTTADTNDVWVTTRAKTALLTADGVNIRDVHVATVDGAVTLHGKVNTGAEKEKAALVVRAVQGVKVVHNLLQVALEPSGEEIKASDQALREAVEAALRSGRVVPTVKVSSASNGVVRLSGRAATLIEKLRAVELVWKVAGVSRVVNEIEAEK